MALFRRRRRAGEETVGRRVVVTDDLGLDEAYDEAHDAELAAEPLDDSGGVADTATGEVDAPPHPRGETGPFDRTEVDGELGDRIDLGSLWLGVIGGAQLRIEVDPQTSDIQAVTTDLDGSLMQVQAFAAPRTTGIWRMIRQEIADSVSARGGAVESRPGRLGTELLTRLPSRGPDGRVSVQMMRFVGVDGPRWFLRAVLTGPAASEAGAAAPFYDMIQRSVVVRGEDARPPREMLPLRLPKDLLEPVEPAAGEQAEEGTGERLSAASARRGDDLRPFERGPEITEIR